MWGEGLFYEINPFDTKNTILETLKTWNTKFVLVAFKPLTFKWAISSLNNLFLCSNRSDLASHIYPTISLKKYKSTLLKSWKLEIMNDKFKTIWINKW